MGVQRLFDGETLYTISPEDEEVTISKDNSEDDNTISPSALLTFYESGYNYKLDISQLKFGRKIQYIKLTPIDSEAEIKKLDKEIRDLVVAAADFAQKSPEPDPSELYTDVLVDA